MDGEGSGIEMILCFVPAHRIGDVQGLIDAVGSLSSARPQP
jgi:hypothetical protein